MRELAEQRDALLERLMARLRDDERVAAVWLSGSFGRTTADDWSDLDLHVAVRDESFAAWLEEREALLAGVGELLMVLPGPASERGEYQGVMFAGPVLLDLAVHPVSMAIRDTETLLLFERFTIPLREIGDLPDDARRSQLRNQVDFFWAMTPIAVKHAGRGNMHRAVMQIDLLGMTFVRIWRLLYEPERRDAGGLHWLQPERDAALIRRLPHLGEAIDFVGVLAAIGRMMDEMRVLNPSLEAAGVIIPYAAIEEIYRFRDAVKWNESSRAE